MKVRGSDMARTLDNSWRFYFNDTEYMCFSDFLKVEHHITMSNEQAITFDLVDFIFESEEHYFAFILKWS